MKKIAIQILLFGIIALPLAAQNFTATTPSSHTVNYKYVYGEPVGTVYVGAASDATYEGDLVIPSTVEYEGTTYTVIGTVYGAFKDKTGLTSITLGDSVHEINSNAFKGCTGLISVSMPGCTSIGYGAFQGCNSLTSVDLSKCITINEYTFYGCSSLISVDLSNCTTIGSAAFQGCTSLTSVTLTQCTSIGIGAFQGCSSLTSVDLSNCTTINDHTFYGCSSLTSVDLSNCTNIDAYAFTSCSSLTSVDLSNYATIGGSAFSGCGSLTSVDLSGCTSIGGSAFSGCSSLTSVDLPSCTTIGASSFEGCGSLVSIKLSDACTSIGSSAFYGNTMLVLTIPDNIDTIGSNAFKGTGILYYHGTATGSPWGAKYHNGVIADDLYYTINDDSTWTLHVGSSVTSIPSDELFNDHVSSIEVDAANSTFASSDGVLYSKNMKELQRVPAARSGNLAIGVGVTSIAKKAFNGCRLIDTLFFNASKCVPAGSVPKFEMLKKNIAHNGNPVYIYLPSYTSGIFDTLTRINVLEVGEEVDTLYYTIASLPGVKRINVSSDNWKYFSHDGLLVNEAGNTVLRCPVGREGAFTFPAGLTRVEKKAFTYCRQITQLDLSGVSYIGGTNRYNEGDGAFAHCTGLRSLTVPATLDTIGGASFFCSWLDTLYYNTPSATVIPNGSLSTQKPASVFQSDSLRVVIVGDGVKTLPVVAFARCYALHDVQMPEGLTDIGSGTFDDCPMLARIALPSTVTTIESSAFSNCTLLDSIVLPDSLQSIGSGAFQKCTSLGEITIPPAVHTIGANAFAQCTGLKRFYYNAVSCAWTTDTITYSGGVKGVKYLPTGSADIFDQYDKSANTVNVGHLIVGEGVRSMLPIWAIGVDTLTLPTTLDSVIATQFKYASNLRQVYFNCRNLRLLNSFYDYADKKAKLVVMPLFGNCENLRHVVFGDSVQSIPTYSFYGCNQVREFDTLILPATLTSLGSGAFENCTQIKEAVIPQGLTEMGSSPFLGCKKLKKITYNATESEYYGDFSLPNLDRGYIPNYALTYDNVSKFIARRDKAALADLLPPVDTIHIGPGVRNIPPCFFGFPWNQVIDTNNFDRTVYIDNQSTDLQRIGNGAFANMVLENAESLFTDSLKYIDQAAFMNTSGLHNVRMAEGCWYVGAGAFRNCQDLDSLWLPSTLRWIGTDAFLLDSSLSYLYYDCDSLGIDHVEPTSCTPFGNTVSLHSIDFGPNVRYLTDGIFYNAEGLKRLELPEGLLKVGAYCFYMKVSDSKYQKGTSSSSPLIPKTPDPEPDNVTFIVSGYISGTVDTASLHYVSFPTTIQSVGYHAFDQGTSPNYPNANPVSHLDTIVCLGTEPAEYGTWILADYLDGEVWYLATENVFEDTVLSNAILMVPCGAKETYENYTQMKPVPAPGSDFYIHNYHFVYYEHVWTENSPVWGDFQHIEEQTPYSVELTVNVDTMGTAEWECAEGGVLLTATPAASHRFVQWSDGETANPRTIVLVSDTALEAQFAWGVYYTLTVASENAARGSATGGGTFIQDTVVTLTATPLYGYHFTQWSDGDTANPRQYTVTANATLNASFAPNQYTLTVLCDSDQGTVSGGGSYDYKTSHSIEATPLTGYHFSQWSDGETANPRNVTLTQDTLFTAEFSINVYTLTVTAGEHGTVSEGGDYEHGTEVTLTATPDEGYHFSQWSDGETANPRTVVMTADITLAAGFAPNRYSVTATVGCGEATVNTVEATADSADYGTTVVLTAIAGEGHYFMNWTDGTVENPRTVTVTQDTVLSACFAVYTYTVTVGCNEERGSVTAEGATGEGGAYRYGDTATLTATANEHWHFVKWSDGSTDNPMKVVVKSNLEYTAIFAIDQHVVTVNSADAAQGTVMGGGKVDYGGEATLTAQAKTGYHFSHWQDGNADNPRVVTVTGDTTFTAYFEANEPDGIADVYEAAGVMVKVVDGCIIVEGAEGRQVRLYDAVGRRIADSHRHLSAGIYLLQVDGLPARRVVVM